MTNTIANIKSRLVLNETTGCLEWSGSLRDGKYGQVRYNNKVHMVHRLLYEAEYGPLGIEPLMHMCDNPKCCNLEHLVPGSAAENTADMFAKGRQHDKQGESNSQAKLTDKIVYAMLDMYYNNSNMKQIEIEQYFNAHRGSLHEILKGRIWSHVKYP